MNTVRWLCATTLAAAVTVPMARAQEPPKPGPEHEFLKKLEGTWDTSMKVQGMEVKGTAVYKMELGGIWLVSSVEGEVSGTKFYGKGLDSYDPITKKYVSVFVDNMGGRPLVMDGTYDKDKKTLTMAGEGPGMDGKTTKYKSVAEMPDDNTINMTMWMGDGKDAAFNIVYKRKK
jgi:hypothetical protein